MKYNEYNTDLGHQMAARLGLVVAGTWIISFLVVVLNFPSFIADLGYVIGLTSIFTVSRNLKGIRMQLMPMSWWQGLSVALLSFMGGALITTLAQYAYFAFLDHGHFLNTMQESLTDQQFVKVMTEAGNGPMLTQLQETVNLMQEMGPRMLAMNFFFTNIILGGILGLLATLLSGRVNRNIEEKK